jgi:hypothetical protein
MPAGTELFFHYGYNDAQTKGFREPGKKSTKVVAVKSAAKAATTTATSSKSQKDSQARPSTPERRRRTEKARAVRLAKVREDKAAMLDVAKGSIGGARKSAQRPGLLRTMRGIRAGRNSSYRSGTGTPVGTSFQYSFRRNTY